MGKALKDLPATGDFDAWYAVALDIETVRDDELVDRLLAEPPEFTPPKNYKDQEKIDAYLASENAKWSDKIIQKAALSPRSGLVAAVAIAPLGPESEGMEATAATSIEMTEKELLEWTNQRVMGSRFLVTFNGSIFDGPFLRTRMLKRDVPIEALLTRFPRYRIEPHCDLRMVLSDWDTHATGSMKFWCDFLGLPPVEKTDPAEIQTLFETGERDALANHCLDHAIATARLYNRLSGCGLVP